MSECIINKNYKFEVDNFKFKLIIFAVTLFWSQTLHSFSNLESTSASERLWLASFSTFMHICVMRWWVYRNIVVGSIVGRPLRALHRYEARINPRTALTRLTNTFELTPDHPSFLANLFTVLYTVYQPPD